MLRKILAVLIAISAGVIIARGPSEAAGPAICDSQQSTLCVGLGHVFGFEENSDNPRWDENKGVAWLEADGQNVARATGKLESYAASFVGTEGNYLVIPRAGSILNGSTVALWIYPTSSAAEQIIISSDEATAHGTYLSLVPDSGNVKVKATAHYGDGRGDVSVTSTSSLTLNAWHLVVWGYDQAEASDFLTTSQTGRIMYLQLDGGARTSVGLVYFPIIGPYNDLVLGQRIGTGTSYTMPYSGRVDQLTFVNRSWDSVAVTEFYNAGSGKTYPFGKTAYASLNDGLVAYWKLDETSGTRYDSVNQNNGTVYSTLTHTTGKIGNGLYKDGSDERMEVPHNSQIAYSGDFAIALWFYDGAAGAYHILQKANFNTYYGEWYISADGRFWVSDSTNYMGGAQTNACDVTSATTGGAWNFVVVDYTASTKTCRISVNGGAWASDVANEVTVAHNTALSFLGDPGTGGNGAWYSTLDEVGLWKRKLTDTEVANLYNSGNGRTYPF